MIPKKVVAAINKFWPVITKENCKEVKRKRNIRCNPKGECKKCGKCCALVWLGYDKQYFVEHIKRWEQWAIDEGKEIPKSTKETFRVYRFFISHFVRISRYEAFIRGFVDEVKEGDFIYSCKLLNIDGTCSFHDKYRPYCCTDYPFYTAKTYKQKRKKKTFSTCGFAMKNKDTKIREESNEKKKGKKETLT